MDERDVQDKRKILNFYLEGLENCGKSTFFNKIANKDRVDPVEFKNDSSKPIYIGVNEKIKVQLNNTEITIKDNPDAIIMLYDSADENSLEFIKNRINWIKNELNFKKAPFFFLKLWLKEKN